MDPITFLHLTEARLDELRREAAVYRLGQGLRRPSWRQSLRIVLARRRPVSTGAPPGRPEPPQSSHYTAAEGPVNSMTAIQQYLRSAGTTFITR
jgi:hypothetical protein